MDSHSAAYWVLTALSAQFTVVQYGIVFAAMVKLRYSQPNTARVFRIPGGKWGAWGIAVVGIAACIFGFFIVYLPPAQLETGDRTVYQAMLAISFVLLSFIPIVFAIRRKLTSV